MKLDVLAIGRLKAGPERELCARYAERLKGLGRGLGLDGPRITELPESAARRDADRKDEEARALSAAIMPGFRVILCEEDGQMVDSEAFAADLARWRDAGQAGLAFVIGGADGLGAAIRERGNGTLCFGRMTLPHQLVRVLLLEQLYRAGTILAGHPYHRA